MSSESVRKKAGENPSKSSPARERPCYDFAIAAETQALADNERIVELVRFLARRAAEDDYKKLLCNTESRGRVDNGSQNAGE